MISCQSKEERTIQIKYSESDRKIVRNARGLFWPQIVIDHRARYIPRPAWGFVDHVSFCSGTRRPRLFMLGDSSIIPHVVLGDCFNYSLTTARRLISSATCEIGLTYSWEIITF
jgi:hypothetical protein